jgi:hypothetical protein
MPIAFKFACAHSSVSQHRASFSQTGQAQRHDSRRKSLAIMPLGRPAPTRRVDQATSHCGAGQFLFPPKSSG